VEFAQGDVVRELSSSDQPLLVASGQMKALPKFQPVSASGSGLCELPPILDHPAGIFPACPDQGGPTAADRSTSAIGVLLPIAL
jgi:hypothetical protein